MKKLHSNRGESLIETLASILIGSLSVALMFGCILISTNMDKEAKGQDDKHYAGLTAADAQDAAPTPDPTPMPDPTPTPDSTPTPKVTIERISPLESGSPAPSAELNITIYGDAGMASYRRAD